MATLGKPWHHLAVWASHTGGQVLREGKAVAMSQVVPAQTELQRTQRQVWILKDEALAELDIKTKV